MENKNQDQDEEVDFYSDDQNDPINNINNDVSIDLDDDSESINIDEANGEENGLFSDDEEYGDDTPVFNEEVSVSGLPEINKDEDEDDELIFDDEEAEDNDENIDDDEEAEDSSQVTISKSKIVLAKKLLENIAENNEKLISLFGGIISKEDEERIGISQIGEGIMDDDSSGKIIEGVFDGENMIGPDGKQYSVPSNYASKSKLVEGDLLKLTITGKGTFVYKQTKPIDRDRVVGILERNEDGIFSVVSGDKRWKVLTASITYFKGTPGDETIILVPKGSDSAWGAVENIVRNK